MLIEKRIYQCIRRFYCQDMSRIKVLSVAEKNDAAKNIAAHLSRGNAARVRWSSTTLCFISNDAHFWALFYSRPQCHCNILNLWYWFIIFHFEENVRYYQFDQFLCCLHSEFACCLHNSFKSPTSNVVYSRTTLLLVTIYKYSTN